MYCPGTFALQAQIFRRVVSNDNARALSAARDAARGVRGVFFSVLVLLLSACPARKPAANPALPAERKPHAMIDRSPDKVTRAHWLLAIRRLYAKIEKSIKSREIYTANLEATLLVIPAIGQPKSRLIMYYEEKSRDGPSRFILCKIEHSFQYAGRLYFEEYIFTEQGDMVFYHGKAGNGSIESPEKTSWTGEERFYFHKGMLLRIIRNGKSSDRPTPKELKAGKARISRADALKKTLRMGNPPMLDEE